MKRPGRDARPSPTAFDRRLIAPMALGSVLNPIDSSVIAVALLGRLVDRYGPRRLYLAGTALVGVAAAATAAFFPHHADTAGLHGPALFLVAGSALPPATTLVDRSPGSLTPRGTTRTIARAPARSTSPNTPGKA
ncbi:hypothetical protein [Streptomyces brasiliensis]|uniref:Uncharacterized protein n=1 Tax=Streptomyces brasiliensis TaxID=1954 RepID=A0A917NFR0_9ACTN|nr:hypothetical protein [Streptomyces brasiliensis]GGI96781.1 hypothetical protein GCM10010121_003960 [Streptomyces brasiliensis]